MSEPEDPFSDGQMLLPSIVQNIHTGKVLMLGYMNREALERTKDTGFVTFFSRSKGRLWTKGEQSGHTLTVIEIRWDCDQDTLLVLAQPQGPTCHTGTESCFDGRPLLQHAGHSPAFETLAGLIDVIKSRRTSDPETSYVAKLLTGPRNVLLKKLVEEAGETMAAVYEEEPKALRSEMADLLFHLLIVMERTGTPFHEVMEILEKRTGTSGLEEKKNRKPSTPNREN